MAQGQQQRILLGVGIEHDVANQHKFAEFKQEVVAQIWTAR